MISTRSSWRLGVIVFGVFVLFKINGPSYAISNEADSRSSYRIDMKHLRLRNANLSFNDSNVKYWRSVGLFDEYEPVDLSNGFPEFQFVTGFDESHAGEGRHLINQFAQKYPGQKIVVYGISLSNKTVTWLKTACNVEFRSFSLDSPKYPAYVRKTKSYRFKALLAAEALKEFPAIIWVDTSTIFSGKKISDFTDMLQKLNTSNQEPHVFLISASNLNGYQLTNPGMYSFIPEVSRELNIKRPQYGSGKIVFYRTPSTMNHLIKWWVLCALEEFCMEPKGSKLRCNWKGKKENEYVGCHRYDQSAVNLILAPYEKSFLPQDNPFVTTLRDVQDPPSKHPVCK